MGNKILKSVLAVIGILLTAYLCFGFVLMDLNPSNWEESVRAGMMVTSLPFVVSAIIFMSLD